jgi:hypothetical protein
MMKKTRIGFLSTSGIVAAILTVLIVGGLALAKGGILFSPGDLNAFSGAILGGVSSHAAIGGECNLCHAPFWSSSNMGDLCETCHTDITTQWNDTSTLHGILHQSNTRATCRTCHPEHRGPAAPVTVMEPSSFPHTNVGYSLAVHQTKADELSFTCSDCHNHNFTQFDQAVCTTCHAKIDASFAQTHARDFSNDCLACHDGLDTFGKNFDHNQVTFQLSGKHAQAECSQCHVNATSLVALKITPQDCISCHTQQDAHQRRLGADCGACHAPVGWAPAGMDHDLIAFKLEGKHTGVNCTDCHINNDYFGTPSDCLSCHQKDDPHNNQFGTTDCGSCHTDLGWQPSTFDHALSTFTLQGRHTAVNCNGCHTNEIYRGIPSDCYTCHTKDDTHMGQLGTSCSNCHTVFGWVPSTFDHNMSSFKLTGRHVSVACDSCHLNHAYRGTPTDCYSCHKNNDAHSGQLGSNCNICHATSGWTPAYYDHKGFALTGGHSGLACTQCHSGGVYSGLSTACVSCHAEPAVHTGQFGTNCAECHNTSNWNATFNHPNACGEVSCVNHKGATCTDCHTVNNDYSIATCTKCHDSNRPRD